MSSLQDQESFTPVSIGIEELPPRFPIRWRWTMLVGFAIALAILVLFLVIMNMERNAWLESQSAQAKVLVGRLGDELKIPMLAGSTAEVDAIMHNFLKKVPSVLGAHIVYASGDQQHYGEVDPESDDLMEAAPGGMQVQRLPSGRLWYVTQVRYAGTVVGSVGVRFSEDAWQRISTEIMERIGIAAVIVVLLSSVLVYWLAGRMSRPLEMLAEAAQHVAFGDYSVRLPVSSNDEISDAVVQFNAMVEGLAHKEEIRDVFGRYLNPKLVSDVFEGSGETLSESHRQHLTVLFADMVGFTSFSESTNTEQIVEVLNKHFEVFHRVIDYYGGHVDKYIGDAVMAVFNHPHEDLDHVRHAAMAGLAIAIACSRLGVLRDNGEPIAFRIGLNHGEAIIGNIGAAERLEYTVIGDTVNVASRMGGLGEGGQVVMSRATYERLGPGFEFKSVGSQEIKGVSKPVECGTIRIVNPELKRNLAHAVALAFDLTLPSDVRLLVGNNEE